MSYSPDAPWRVTAYAQQLLGVPADGVWGPRTESAYRNASQSLRARIDEALAKERLSAYSVQRVTTQVRRPVPASTSGAARVKGYSVPRATTQVRRPVPVSTPDAARVKGSPQLVASAAPTAVKQLSLKDAFDLVPSYKRGSKLADHIRKILLAMGYSERAIAAILKQVQIESSMGANLREMMHGTRTAAVRAKISAFARLTDEEFANLKSRTQYFEAAYGAHTPKGVALGNTKPGDGGLYYGRGLIQETGRWNYARISQISGVDFLRDPDLLAASWPHTWRGFLSSVEARFGNRKQTLTAAQVRANVNPGLA